MRHLVLTVVRDRYRGCRGDRRHHGHAECAAAHRSGGRHHADRPANRTGAAARRAGRQTRHQRDSRRTGSERRCASNRRARRRQDAAGADTPPGAETPEDSDKDPYEGIAPEDLPPDLQYDADSSVSFPTNT